MLARGKQPQRVGFRKRQHRVVAEAILEHIVVHDIAAYHDDVFATQVVFRFDGGSVTTHENCIMDNGKRR